MDYFHSNGAFAITRCPTSPAIALGEGWEREAWAGYKVVEVGIDQCAPAGAGACGRSDLLLFGPVAPLTRHHVFFLLRCTQAARIVLL